MDDTAARFRTTVRLVALANLGYFAVEFGAGLSIGSVSLFADSVDFLEDASVNLLILLALGWSASARARVGMLLAGLLLAPGIATIWTAWSKFNAPAPPAPWVLSATGLGAMAVNLTCAFALARFRRAGGSLAKTAFLSARNDVLSNIGIVAAGLATFVLPSAWPDIAVGLAIAVLNAGAAREVWETARQEHRQAQP